MIELHFSGWFQCRLATDPDPSDEARGVSGWTFALPGEPPLDRRIRTQPVGTIPRTHCPTVGITVKAVIIDGASQAPHPLLGAAFELLDDPVFEGRNGLASEDTEEPIFPFHFRISQAGALIEGQHRDRVSGAWLFERASGIEPVAANVQAASGTANAQAYWQARRDALETELATTPAELEKAALRWRLVPIVRGLEAEDSVVGAVPLAVGLRYRYAFEGPWQQTNLPGISSSGWSLNLWVGCWDADALCGFMDGQVVLPTNARGHSSI